MTKEGPAGYATGGSSYTSPNHGNMAAGDLTVRIRFVPVSISGAYSNLATKASGGTASLVAISIVRYRFNTYNLAAMPPTALLPDRSP